MMGRGGLFRQENMEKRKIMSVREWVDLCSKEEYRAPGVRDLDLHSRSENAIPRVPKTRRGKKNAQSAESPNPDTEMVVDAKTEADDDIMVVVPGEGDGSNGLPPHVSGDDAVDREDNTVIIKAENFGNKRNPKPKRQAPTRETKEANLAERHAQDAAFLETFDPHSAWLPSHTTANDYTPEFCRKLERQYWRNCGLGKPAWYGADTQGTVLFYSPLLCINRCCL